MNETGLKSKHLAELHALAAEAGIPKYRMLRREQLIDKLTEQKPRHRRERKPRQRRERPKAEEPAPPKREERQEAAPAPAAPARPRRRRRRRFGRKRKELRLHDLLIPVRPGRQVIVYAETREGCTALLREFAGDSKGADPVALLVEPGPEELAEWRREAPQAEIVAAAQARHVDDAFAQARRRAESGEDVIVLIDSLTRLAEKFGDAEGAKDLLDAGPSGSGSGSLTVVAALERR